ncbi:hypothetical protein B296_00019758 [Ensete ventricosum]|uniref:Uncharacterized protein n=1 Tax=Ensete ventricosum TaxID=4639 RepID=A0A427AEL1_ENSVE|nr:hypothetical protein B296_00019758 [Ensete ventricosum]
MVWAVRIGPTEYRYVDRPLPGGTMRLPARGRGDASCLLKIEAKGYHRLSQAEGRRKVLGERRKIWSGAHRGKLLKKFGVGRQIIRSGAPAKARDTMAEDTSVAATKQINVKGWNYCSCVQQSSKHRSSESGTSVDMRKNTTTTGADSEMKSAA